MKTELSEHFAGDRHLPLAAIDQHEIGKRADPAPPPRRACRTAAQHLRIAA